MVIARKMGYSESEFWNSDPIFFNEVTEAYFKLEHAEKNVRYLPTDPKANRRLL